MPDEAMGGRGVDNYGDLHNVQTTDPIIQSRWSILKLKQNYIHQMAMKILHLYLGEH